MSEDAPANPRGIFDRTSKGKAIEPVLVDVERGRIRFFADVLQQTDPVHFDLEAARAAGHPDLVAPASFFMVVEALANEDLERNRRPTPIEMIRCDLRYLLHGGERYFYEAPIYAGEQVEFSTRIVDFYDKKGGSMEFVTIESSIASPKRGVLVRSERTLLHRLPESVS